MSLYHACYDASGSEKDRARPSVMGGLLAPVPKWDVIDREWSEVLTEFDVPSLHLVDLAQWKKEYKSWGRDEEA